MASLPLDRHQELQKSDPALAVSRCKGAPICLHTSLKGAKNILYMIIMDVRSNQFGLRPQPLRHGITPTR